MADAPVRLRVLRGIEEVSREAWDRLLGPSPLPFVRWDWLDALEASGSATPRTGWTPRHLTLWRGEKLVAAAPAYLKQHSMGEYVYDFAWADGAERLGVRYYPKLLVGVPLSPVTAPRLLTLPSEEPSALRCALVKAVLDLARDEGCSSVHAIFLREEETTAFADEGFFPRSTMQYHWHNPGYASYDDFLGRFSAKRRHQLRRERAAAAAQGIALRTVRGEQLAKSHALLAHAFYRSTCEKNPWGRLMLTEGFFVRAFETLGEHFELVEAVREGRVVAGTFNVVHGERLYGRYWGSFEEHPFLHFHACLYHPIDDCIRLGRKAFEPGAGGEHKIARGFEPALVRSAHRIFDPALEAAVRTAVERERRQLQDVFAQAEEIAGLRPFEPTPDERPRTPGAARRDRAED